MRLSVFVPTVALAAAAAMATACAVNVDRLGAEAAEGEGEAGGAAIAPADGGGGDGEAAAPGPGAGAEAGEGEGEGQGDGPVDVPLDGTGEGEGEPGGEGVGDGEGEGEGEPDNPPPLPPPAGPAPALLRVTPSSALLGDVDVGASSVAAAFTVASTGGQALTGLTLTLDGDDFALEADCPQDGVLAAGAACVAQVTFSPSAPGPAVGVLVADADGGLVTSVVVRGQGLALPPDPPDPPPDPADLVLVAGEGAFGQASEPDSREFTFLNRGEMPTRELLALVDGAAFNLAEDGCSFAIVPPAQTCTLTVVFGPPANGEYSGELLLWSDSPLRVPLSGRGVDVADAVLAVGSPIVDFGVAVAGDRFVRRLAVRNDGARPLERLRVRLVAPAAFSVIDPGAVCAIGQDLGGGASCEVALAFEPDGEGLHNGELHVGAAGIDDIVVFLAGRGEGFDPAVLVSDAPGGLLAFGEVEGVADRVVTFRNEGDAPSGALRISMQGEGFELGDIDELDGPLCPGSLLGPGQSCQVPVRFDPARNGLHDGELTAADGGQVVRVVLTGRGAGHGPPEVETEPPALDFGVVDSGDAADALTVEIRNVGDLPAQGLTIRLIGPHAGDYLLARQDAAQPCPADGEALAAGALCAVSVAFRPRAEGERIAELEVAAVDVEPAITSLGGTGRGFAPADLQWRVAPDPDFGDVHEVEPRGFWVQNLGGRTSGQLSIRLTGAPEFRIDPGDDDCAGRTLAPLAECEVIVTFVTADNGEYSARLEVSDRDQAEAIELAAQSVGWLPANLQADPDSLSFGDLDDLDRSEELEATITNAGELPVAGIDVLLDDAAGVFELLNDNLLPPVCEAGLDLLGGQTCRILAVLVPPDDDAIGSWRGTVTVGAGDHTVDVALSGRRGVATNCKEIYDGDNDAPDGVYTIDPDADGGQAPFDAYCVMSVAGGGWTTHAYIKAIGQWPWNVMTDVGEVGDIDVGFAQGATLRAAQFPVTEKVIIYRKLIENGNDLGTHWMALRRTNNQPLAYQAIENTGSGWTYTDSRGAGPVDAGNVCTHGCSTYAGHGMFHDSSNIGYHGTQSGNYGCRDGNNICWRSQGQGCNVGAGRCSYLPGQDEGVIYAVR